MTYHVYRMIRPAFVSPENPAIEFFEFDTEAAARALIKEELKWESTDHVACPELTFFELGDFA